LVSLGLFPNLETAGRVRNFLNQTYGKETYFDIKRGSDKISYQRVQAGGYRTKKQAESLRKLLGRRDKKFEDAFKKPDIGNAFAKESMMGYEKFGGYAFPSQPGGDSNGLATHMLIWDYRMDRLKFLKIDDSFIAKTAKKMNVKPDIKSGSYKASGVKAGYSFYQALRVSVKVLLDKTGEIEESAINVW
jgi:hypothetical protein